MGFKYSPIISSLFLVSDLILLKTFKIISSLQRGFRRVYE
jgi:hypothetical protein